MKPVLSLLAAAALGLAALPAFSQPGGAPTARLQVAHLAPFAPGAGTAVNIALNGSTALSDVSYGESTAYIELPAGSYLVEIFPVGSGTAAISANVNLDAGVDYTAIAVGNGAQQPLGLLALVDEPTAPPAGDIRLRLGHLAPFASGAAVLADVRLEDGTPVVEGVTFGDVTGYLGLPGGSYDLRVTAPGDSATLINPLPVDLPGGTVIRAFAVGDGVNQDLGVFALPQGAPGFFLPLGTTPPPGTARLQVAHLAPFAPGAGTAVDIALNGTTALSNVSYGASTGYLDVPAGDYLVEIFPVGSGTAAISANVSLAADTDYTAIAVGNGSNQPLGLIALVDEQTPPPAGDIRIRVGHLAPFASGAAVLADVRLEDGTPVVPGVTFGDVTGYLALPGGSYDLRITSPGGATTLINPLPVNLPAGTLIRVFAAGDGSNQPLGVFALPQGSPGSFLPLGTTPPPTTGGVQAVPSLAAWGVLLLGALVVLLAAGRLRRAVS
ncbi:MAG: DUF4397 domain-containing protein [Pseudoxanthomonas sp.]|nr:DUF4397 domain-containing protein [Pseudoxanthomonas sp.]